MDKETRTAFDDLKSYIKEQTTQLDAKVDRLDEKVDKRVGSLEREFSDLNVRLIDEFRAIDRRFEKIDHRFEGVVDEVSERVASHIGVLIEENRAYNKVFWDELRGHKGVLEDHGARLERLENPPPRPGTSTLPVLS